MRFAERLEGALDYRFQDQELLTRALTHSSYVHESHRVPVEPGELAQLSNEQFEFLGDAILGFVISEELVRLRTHADQTDTLLSAEGETGKKLDFLLQEMNRETNTILSKTGGLGEQGLTLTDLGLAAKAEIDRIREQSLNIE